ncbi:putative nucleic acid-binding, replication factor A [Helianthus annuus]|nr:putative nucleic acid-binding, replication factor A [Helianthus annuus]
METERLSALRVGSPAKAIHVRLLRKWNPRYQPQDICYIFVDKFGDAIQAITESRDKISVEPKLNMLMSYRIEHYVCGSISQYHNILSHPVNLRLGSIASIVPTPDNNELPRSYFNFCTYERLEPLCGSKDQVIDFIGLLQRIDDNMTKDNEPYVNLTLTDSNNNNIVATLWKEISTSKDRFNRSSIENSHYPSVIAVTAMKVIRNRYLNNLQLWSTYPTYVYLNLDTTATQVLKDRYTSRTSGNPQSQPHTRITTRTLFPSDQTLTTLASLQMKDQEDLNAKTFLCNATITEVLPDQNWYYTACPVCFKTIYTSGDKWVCPSDGYYDTPKYMYRVVATIKDSTGTTALATMFNDAVKALLGRESSDVVTKEAIPMLIDSIQGKEKKFYLQAQKDKRSGNLKCTVNRIVDVDPPTPSSPAHSINPQTPQQKPHATTVTSATKRTLFESPDDAISDSKKTRYPE